MSKISSFSGLLVAFLLSASAHADEPDAYRGMAFAQQLCAGCHSIDKAGSASPNPMALPFADIAKLELLNAEGFANWLGTAHPAINGIAIKPAVAADLLAYIRSIGQAKEHAGLSR